MSVEFKTVIFIDGVTMSQDDQDLIKQIMRAGLNNRILAIKVIRRLYGCGLKDAKDISELLIPPTHLPTQVSRHTGNGESLGDILEKAIGERKAGTNKRNGC